MKAIPGPHMQIKYLSLCWSCIMPAASDPFMKRMNSTLLGGFLNLFLPGFDFD